LDANKRFRITKGNQLHTSNIRELSNNTGLVVMCPFVILAPVLNLVRVSYLFKSEYCVHFNKVLQFYVHFYIYIFLICVTGIFVSKSIRQLPSEIHSLPYYELSLTDESTCALEGSTSPTCVSKGDAQKKNGRKKII
jgi:hypothetical protein